MIDTYLEFVGRPVVSGQLAEDINDMTIMRELRPTWQTLISYLDNQFAKDDTRDNWHASKMVHYSCGLTPCPRAETILNARDLFT